MKKYQARVILCLLLLLATDFALAAEEKKAPPKKKQAPTSAVVPAKPVSGSTETLERSTIFGDRELPNIMYIVPWKRPEMGDMVTKPVKSLLDETIAPLDRDVFQREIRFFEELHSTQALPIQEHKHE